MSEPEVFQLSPDDIRAVKKENDSLEKKELAYQRKMNEEVLQPLVSIMVAKHWESLNALMLEHQANGLSQKEIRDGLLEIIG